MQIRKLLTAAILTLVVCSFANVLSAKAKPVIKATISKESAYTDRSTAEMALAKAMRKFWEDHITWTRIFIIGAAADLADEDAATQRYCRTKWISVTPLSHTTERPGRSTYDFAKGSHSNLCRCSVGCQER